MTTTTKRTIEDELELAAEIIGCKTFGFADGPRIEFKLPWPEIEAWFEFPDADYDTPQDIDDGVLCLGDSVFDYRINSCDKKRIRFLENRAKDCAKLPSLALTAFLVCNDEELARKILVIDMTEVDWDDGKYEDEDEIVDELGRLLDNGRIDEAKQLVDSLPVDEDLID